MNLVSAQVQVKLFFPLFHPFVGGWKKIMFKTVSLYIIGGNVGYVVVKRVHREQYDRLCG
jgi:hypothetical protein